MKGLNHRGILYQKRIMLFFCRLNWLQPPRYNSGNVHFFTSLLVFLHCGFAEPACLSQKAQVKYGVRSTKFIWAPVFSCSLAVTPQLAPSLPHSGSHTRAILVSQDRRQIFVTLCQRVKGVKPISTTTNRINRRNCFRKIKSLATVLAIAGYLVTNLTV